MAAKFSKRHYIVIAEVLRDKRNCLDTVPAPTKAHLAAQYESFWDTTERITGALFADNPRFNREHFLAVVRGERDLNSRPKRGAR